MTVVLSVLLATAAGLASALVPLVNAEAYAVVAGAKSHAPWVLVLVVAALASGQTAGKLVLFESARRGAGRWAARATKKTESSRGARWFERVTGWLRSDRTGGPVVLASAALGLPPLAIVSLAAGMSGQRRWVFGSLCLLGRTARFAALVVPAAYAVG